MEVPREGRKSEHLGLFLWPRVLQHEYTHTITLAQTGNRIPHWLTEAAAVSMEQAPRDYDDCMTLAESWRPWRGYAAFFLWAGLADGRNGGMSGRASR